MLIDMLYCSQGKLSLNEMKDPSITRENDSDAGKVGIQNPELWNPEYSLRNPESPLTIRIQNPFPLTKIRNPVPGIRIQRPGIQSPRLLIKKKETFPLVIISMITLMLISLLTWWVKDVERACCILPAKFSRSTPLGGSASCVPDA